MTILICQLITPNIDDYAKYSVSTLLKYATHHGYQYAIQRDALVDDLHINWSKIKLLQILLKEKYDYVVLFDADLILTDTMLSIEQLIEKGSEKTLIYMVEDTPIFKKYRPNAGIIGIRNVPKGREIIEKWLEAAYADQDLADTHPRNQNIYWKYLMPGLVDNQCLIERRLVSKYNTLEKLLGYGKFAFHFTSTSNAKRLKQMKDAIPREVQINIGETEKLLKQGRGLIRVR